MCSNGSTRRSHHSITKVYSPEVKELGRLLELNEVFAPLKRETEKMLICARQSMTTTASVRELGVAVKLLNEHGLASEDSNQIIPYERTKGLYVQAGYKTDAVHMAQAKSEMTMWELFNMLTFFATHNQLWSAQDIRRTSLMEASIVMLMREHDIKEYYNIF